jgi:hypothetical protein
MRRQEGITLSGFMLWAIVGVFAALLGFKIGPAYFEYFTIQKQLRAISKDSASGAQRREVEDAFVRRSSIENITSITAKDLTITAGSDGIVISVEYTTCVNVVANLRACMDFAPSSARR